MTWSSTVVVFFSLVSLADALAAKQTAACTEFSFSLPATRGISTQTHLVRADPTTVLRFERLDLGAYASVSGRDYFVIRAESLPDADESILRESGTGLAVHDDPSAVALYRTVVQASINQVISAERQRREFSEDQLVQLADGAREHEGRTTYVITVEDGKIIGSLRFISAPYIYAINRRTREIRMGNPEHSIVALVQALPPPILTSLLLMERILNIQLPRPTFATTVQLRDESGEEWELGSNSLTEPGSLFIEPQAANRAELLAVFAYQYVLYLYRNDPGPPPIEGQNAITHFTWAEGDVGLRLHSLNGFHALADQPAVSDGVIVLGASSRHLEEKFFSDRSDKRLPKELLERLKAAATDAIAASYPRFAWTLESPLHPPMTLEP